LTRSEQEEHRQKLITSGRLGGLKAQEEKRKESSEASSEASSENEALQSSSSSSSVKPIKKNKKQKPIILSELQFGLFNLFYEAYPKHESKEDAKKAWSEIEPEPDDLFVEKVISTINSYIPKWAEDDYKYVPLPSTWIRAKKWNDEIVVPSNGHKDITAITKFAKGPAEWLKMRKQARGEL
jgi:hypothetical protein